ncbi:DUF1810 domain-containing protein [Gephyromycinifex aptenodytis]|uniref:DUF1810 domain-containing protein n=1 Tax=Gephyromycinifex aptenodytis TaxID=2716227 RepID=UPI001447F4C2|nr:DUF1810 domain-containing protein [Gephyromycinifex aptenodytis]
MTTADLERFVTAQDQGGTYQQALAEVRRGRKSSHWMWFIYPQIAGLGSSPTAQHYAIHGLEQARAYLAHPVLGPRLLESAQAALEAPGSDARAIFGGIDALKLRSSMTLFASAAPDESVFTAVLDRFFDGPDPRTQELLGS